MAEVSLYHAIKHLFPNAQANIDFVLQDDSDGKGPYIRDWNLPDDKPGKAAIAQAKIDCRAKMEAEEGDRKRLQSSVRGSAQSAVGKRVSQLNDIEVREMLAILIWESGGLTDDETIKPLEEWKG